VENATFLKGTIEAIPLPAGSVDVVISNCVINLAADKAAVLREAYRVLKPGGRLAVSDMVEVETLPAALKQRLDTWAGCISGTIPVAEYRQIMVDSGFTETEIEVHSTQTMPGGGTIGSAYIRARKSS
jgi:SAM-dependent methyltransferase